MPRNMSFSKTIKPIKNKTKTVTRRTAWRSLKPGTILWACEKTMGLKKGEKVKRICKIKVVEVSQERLGAITQEEVVKEGFPGMSVGGFLAMFADLNKCADDVVVTRIEFEYV